MKIMCSSSSLKFCNIIKTVTRFNGARSLPTVGYCRNLSSFPSRKSVILSQENYITSAKFKTLRTFDNNGVPKIATLLGANFHTTRSCRSIGPFVYAFFKPLVNIFGIIVGRRFKAWWKALPPSRKQEISDKVKANSRIIVVGSSAFAVGCYCFYLVNLTEAPITKRKRFIVYSKTKLLQITEIQNNFLHALHEKNILPTTSYLYKRIAKIVIQILEKNQDIEEIRNVPWSVCVISDAHQKNIFVLPDGSIYVFTGILDVCKNDDQLAFVLAHEISHVLMSHVEENISRGYFMEMLILMPIMLFWATLPGELAIISHWITNRINHIMIMLPFCRSTEIEADFVALKLIAKACYDVREAGKFWNNMAKHNVNNYPTQQIEWLSTHPHSSKREKFLNGLMPSAIKLREACGCPPLMDDKKIK